MAVEARPLETPPLKAASAPSPAVAPPPGNPRFVLFDSVRAIAVLGVLLYHVCAISGALNRRLVGDFMTVASVQAVDVLFMTSGFLLYRPFVRARAIGGPAPGVRRYFRRRVLRIVPAYWFALTVLAIFPGIVGVFTGDWWRYYFFLQLYSGRTVGGGIPSAWTLCVDVSFYFVLPLWAYGIRRLPFGRRRWIRTELLALGLIAMPGIVIQVLARRLVVSQLVATSLLGNSTWFVLGMTLAVTSVAITEAERPRPRAIALATERPGACWLLAAASLVGVTAVLHPGGPLGVLLSLRAKQSYTQTVASIALTFGVCTFVMAPAVLLGGPRGIPQRIMAWRPLVWVGVGSYGVYLWHLTVVSLLGESADRASFTATGLGLATKLDGGTTPILLLLTLAGTAVIVALSYQFVELPFLRRKEGPLLGSSAFAERLRRVAPGLRR